MKEKVLEFFFSKPRRRVTPLEILKGLGLPRDRLGEVTEILRQLARDGKIVRLKKSRYALPGSQNYLIGKVQAHPDGFGFLIPEERGREDVYLSRREMRRVMHGDRVLVRLESGRGRDERARIVQILERGQKRLIGTYSEFDGKPYLIPMDPRVGQAIPLLGVSAAPKTGTVVAAEISRYGTGFSPPEAELVQSLGDPDHPDVQAAAIVFQYGLPTAFPPDAEREAQTASMAVRPEDIEGRTDLRNLPIVTIDGEQARDFDDAVTVQKEDGFYRLYVSIADVAHYVKPGSALDREAYERGNSVYFPDRAIPMLPEELSNGICSLNPGEDRLAQTVLLKIDPKGEVRAASFFPSVIRSAERMTYTDVRRILVDRDEECIGRYRSLVGDFRLMEELALLLMERRRERGNLDFDLPEAEILLDLQGMPENIARAERHIGHRIIEEFMIAANEAVARHLTEKELPLLYRVHDAPEEETLHALFPLLSGLGYRLPLRRGKVSPKDLQRLLEACRGKPEEKVLNHVILRAMKQARYAPENIGHFGLASTCYAHFTSPIRRYPDLVVHRMLERARTAKKPKPKEREDLLQYLGEAGKHTSERERHAMDAEREMVDLKKAQFMRDKIGDVFSGFVVGLANFGFFVELEAYFVEGLVRLGSLTDDSYQFYEKEYLIKGRRTGRAFRLGDRVTIKVVRVHAFRGEIDFELVE